MRYILITKVKTNVTAEKLGRHPLNQMITINITNNNNTDTVYPLI